MSLDVYLDGGSTFSSNITHNLGKMAAAAGIYECLWRPEEMLAPGIAAVLHDTEEQYGYHDERALKLREQLPKEIRAREISDVMRRGYELLKSDPERFEAFNAPNGWGLYKHFLPWVEEYLTACEANPDSFVTVSR